MKLQLKKQLKDYAGFVAAILVTSKADAQVYYHDFSPDIYFGVSGNPCIPDYYNLDLDNDLIVDFKLSAHSCAQTTTSGHFYDKGFIDVDPLNSNNIVVDTCTCPWGSTSSFSEAVEKMTGGVINNLSKFSPDKRIFYLSAPSLNGNSSFFGNWPPPSTGYMGFKINKSGVNYYGWLKLEVISRSECILMEYAYQQTPGGPIKAGDTTNYYANVPEIQFDCSYSQADNQVNLYSKQPIGQAIISVYDLLGKETQRQDYTGKQASVKIEKKGIYFITIQTERILFRKKIFVY